MLSTIHLLVGIIALGATSSIAFPEKVEQSSQRRANCPTGLGTYFQFPHLILPISSEKPDHAFNNSLVASVSPTNITLFTFDIPPTYNGTCALLFLFPYGTDLDPTAGKYYFSGTEAEIEKDGGLNFALLTGNAQEGTTFITTPDVAVDYGKTQIIPGEKYTISTFPCPSGQRVTYAVASRGEVELDYFQNSGDQAIGLYVVPC